jgi:glutamine synthetase
LSSSRGSSSAKAAHAALKGFGENLFKGAVAAPYLSRYGLAPEDLATGSWVKDLGKADCMARAIKDWAVDRGAINFCHVFQPMAATYRFGQSGMVQLAMFEFSRDGTPTWDFKGKDLLRGETDGSSYPNGGLRATHTAGGYLTIDPESPIYLKGDAIFAPACLVSFEGKALDEKTPLKRSVQALSRSGRRLFKALGVDIDGMVVNIGLEQEFFFVPRDQYYRRPDLQMVGRTLMGRLPARGQELCDHYMAPIMSEGAALKCMQEIQQECFKMGIPLRTRHREVAPNQYEFAPLFGPVSEHTDENLRIMQIMEEVSFKHGLACLLMEKPFQGVNGSGKHNNWSISAVKKGKQTNLYNPSDLTKMTGKKEVFPIIMAATVAAVDKFGDLMRAAISCPGNDFRLGAMEAPPAVISTYLGASVTDYLQSFVNGDIKEYQPRTKNINLGVETLPQIEAPAEDRNRTSPFPFGGHRFEFRACGSSQNVSMVNTVLAAMMANEFKEMADKVEEGYSAVQVAQALLKAHSKVVYNGNGYDPQWPDKAKARGVCRIDSGVDAVCTLTEQKNIDLFAKTGVLTAEEVHARKDVMLELYVGTVEMEVLAMVDMINQHVIPSMKAAGKPEFVGRLEAGAARLEAGLKVVHAAHDAEKSAKSARQLRLETMIEVRAICDEAESKCPADLWTLATYKELFFLDMNAPSKE